MKIIFIARKCNNLFVSIIRLYFVWKKLRSCPPISDQITIRKRQGLVTDLEKVLTDAGIHWCDWVYTWLSWLIIGNFDFESTYEVVWTCAVGLFGWPRSYCAAVTSCASWSHTISDASVVDIPKKAKFWLISYSSQLRLSRTGRYCVFPSLSVANKLKRLFSITMFENID